jgi:hypothetical protein
MERDEIVKAVQTDKMIKYVERTPEESVSRNAARQTVREPKGEK